MVRHSFQFATAYRVAGFPFGVRPSTTWVEIDDGLLRVRFGPWRLHTDLHNISGVEQSGDYAFIKTAGPAHLSLADRGVTFATNARHGICLTFKERVPVTAAVGRLRCPGLTLTPEHPAELLRDLAARGVPVAPAGSHPQS